MLTDEQKLMYEWIQENAANLSLVETQIKVDGGLMTVAALALVTSLEGGDVLVQPMAVLVTSDDLFELLVDPVEAMLAEEASDESSRGDGSPDS